MTFKNFSFAMPGQCPFACGVTAKEEKKTSERNDGLKR